MSNSKDRYVLLNPGPVTLTDSVRQAMTQRDLCHREPAFAELMADIRNRLVRIYDGTGNDFTAVLITGSGTAAVEAMLTSLSENRKSLVAANGVYGERMATMLTRAGHDVTTVVSEWQQPIDFEAIETQLKSDPSIHYVIAVHHETTTGRLNDLDRLADICHRNGRRMLLDTVSSFGGEQIDFENWPIDAVAATGNKCLHGVTGIAFVLVRRHLLENDAPRAPGLYLDLATNYSAQQNGYPAFTPAIRSMYALQQALCELEDEGGWKHRRDIYRQRSRRVLEAFAGLGISPLLSNRADHSAVLTSYRLPNRMNYHQISDPLQQQRIVIYAGQKQLEAIIFRVAVMGALLHEDIESMIQIVSELCTLA